MTSLWFLIQRVISCETTKLKLKPNFCSIDDRISGVHSTTRRSKIEQSEGEFLFLTSHNTHK